MRHTRRAALILVLTSLTAVAASAETLGNYEWGASAAAITSQTGAVPGSGGAGDLVKRESILGREAYVTYQFDSAGLSAVGIQWDATIFSIVKKSLDSQYGQSRCANDEAGCTWTSPRSNIRLVETPSLGVTLLVFSKRA